MSGSDGSPIPHPAKFNREVLEMSAHLLADRVLGAQEAGKSFWVLDPFAGVGGVHQLRGLLPGVFTIGVELEAEWAEQSDYTVCGDALVELGARESGVYDAVVTSPAYGNRMADKYAGDPSGSRRHTYRIDLGRPLSVGSSAVMQWGDEYRGFHVRVWGECVRVLKPGGVFVLNVKDHVRGGVVQEVSRWHVVCLQELGLRVVDWVKVETGGIRHGRNHELRVGWENVVLLERPGGS